MPECGNVDVTSLIAPAYTVIDALGGMVTAPPLKSSTTRPPQPVWQAVAICEKHESFTSTSQAARSVSVVGGCALVFLASDPQMLRTTEVAPRYEARLGAFG